MRIHHQLHGLANQLEGDLVALPLLGHRAVILDQAVMAVQEEFVELRGEDAQRAYLDEILTVAFKRSNAVEACIRDLVVALLHPSPQGGGLAPFQPSPAFPFWPAPKVFWKY